MEYTVNISVKDDYKCPICYEIMKISYQTYPCGHNFCGNCEKKLSQTKKCGVCRTTDCVYNRDIRFEREILNSSVKCPACDKHIEFGEIEYHLSYNCEKFNINCDGCKKYIKSSEFKNHVDICEKFYTDCEECGCVFKKKDIVVHKSYYCIYSSSQILTECKICDKQIPIVSFSHHYENEHLKRISTKNRKRIFRINY